jgi:hypothetical protein
MRQPISKRLQYCFFSFKDSQLGVVTLGTQTNFCFENADAGISDGTNGI